MSSDFGELTNPKFHGNGNGSIDGINIQLGRADRGQAFVADIERQERLIIERDERETHKKLKELEERERIRQTAQESTTNTGTITTTPTEEQEA